MEKTVLIIILDVNPTQKLIKQVITQCLDSMIVFANAFLMGEATNELAVMACNGQGAKFIYPLTKMPEIRQFDGQYEKFSQLERTVRQQVHKIVKETPTDPSSNSESLISGAISIALCYISRLEREKYPGEKLHPRILVLTASHDAATQYMNYMNIFFTSQKMVCDMEIGFNLESLKLPVLLGCNT